MKKNHIVGLIATVFLFAFQLVQAQTNLASNEYGSRIQNYLDQNKDKYDLSENDLSNLLVSDAYFSQKTAINHIYVNQAYQDIKIHNAISSVAVRNSHVFYYANAFIDNIAAKVNTVTPSIDGQAAISVVANEYNLGNVSNLTMISNNNNSFVFSNGNISQENIPVSLVFQPTLNGQIRLAWDLSIRALNNKNWYSVRVDAVDGQVLDTNDWIVSCDFGDGNHASHANHNSNKTETLNLFKTSSSMMVDGSSYNVFPIPTESPNHGPIQLITEPADLVASPFGWHDTNGVVGAEFTITRGNNVLAQEDTDGNDGTGFSPVGNATLTFNFPYDGDQQPIGFQNVAITNLFYMNNIMHDVWYQYGFDEVSGNFQQNNYGNGGLGSDFVFADAQDGSGLDNAIFGTPPDGGNPGMTMFLWNAGGLGTPLTINSGGPLVGDITAAVPATGQGNTIPGPTATPVTADLVLVDDSSAAPTEACNAVTNGAALNGKIAVIKRGNCNFTDKIQNALDGGAIGFIMVNHDNPTNDPAYVPYVNMSGPMTMPDLTKPSVFVNNADGQQIIDALIAGATINATIVEGGPYQKDGSIDNGVIAHEYGHGISTRLAGGPSTSNCLGNAEQMGEGWSDWFALMVTIKATDLPETGRGIATYAVSQPVDGPGIRPAPYSTDTSVNGLTYADTNDTANISSPHGIGSVWATILWDLSWAYINKYGFDADVYNGVGGNNKAMQLVLDGLKLQVCGAGFVEARDALLSADNALTGGEDQCMIWEVFAARGVGVNASQGTFGSRSDQIEDFTELPSTDSSLQNCTSLSVDEFNVSNYSIFPNPTNDVLNIKVKKDFGKVTMTLTDLNGRIVLTKNASLSSTSQLNISALQSGVYILTIKGENINTNDKILKN
ncbi:T9SS-dependent M36 family metallopeptidase [Lacinutrix jangbogonensis]|uniref:T9SS-dependent M36 family metallopeptidase n=1 Tax=Lacinutrix jangbogonensis TaxID=1469557 RepID=UPI00053D04B4|nr:T9SS-dependent M36 family metallopeptidase [Lacinutrix jangbogonensis]